MVVSSWLWAFARGLRGTLGAVAALRLHATYGPAARRRRQRTAHARRVAELLETRVLLTATNLEQASADPGDVVEPVEDAAAEFAAIDGAHTVLSTTDVSPSEPVDSGVDEFPLPVSLPAANSSAPSSHLITPGRKTINFENLPRGTLLSTQYRASTGVRFWMIENDGRIISGQYPHVGRPSQQQNRVSGNVLRPMNSDGRTRDVRLDFDVPINGFRARVISANEPYRLDAYYKGQLVQRVHGDHSGGQFSKRTISIGFGPNDIFDRIEIHIQNGRPNPGDGTQGGGPESWDDFEFDVLPTMTIVDTSIVESDAGQHNVVFGVALSGPLPSEVTAVYNTSNGTASAGDDYIAQSGTVRFAPNDTHEQIFVPIRGDRLVEQNETFFITLTNSTRAIILDGQAQATILNDDQSLVSISPDRQGTLEGSSGQITTLTYNVTLSNPVATSVTIPVQTVNGTATAGTDYIAASRNLVFPASTSTTSHVVRQFSVQVQGDNTPEPDEFFRVQLANPIVGSGYNVRPGTVVSAQADITNDDFQSPAPAAPDLIASHDSGASNSDNITNVRRPGFDVSGVVPGATVELLVNGTVADSRVATGSVVRMSPNFNLSERSNQITARQRVPNQSVSGAGPALTVTLDTLAPVVGVDATSTADGSPRLTGSINEASAFVRLVVRNGQGIHYSSPPATNLNNGNGTWTLADNAIAPSLPFGVYDVQTTAIDIAGNSSMDTTTNELTIARSQISPIANLAFVHSPRNGNLTTYHFDTDGDFQDNFTRDLGWDDQSNGNLTDVGHLPRPADYTGDGVTNLASVHLVPQAFGGSIQVLIDTDPLGSPASNPAAEIVFEVTSPNEVASDVYIPLAGNVAGDVRDDLVLVRAVPNPDDGGATSVYEWRYLMAEDFPTNPHLFGDPVPSYDVRSFTVMPGFWGFAGDEPVLGDWTGDGRDKPGVVSRVASNGMKHWFLAGLPGAYAFGDFNARTVVGDWDGDGDDNLGAAYGRNGVLEWSLDTDFDSAPEIVAVYGGQNDFPVVGNWLRPDVVVTATGVPSEGDNGSTPVNFDLRLSQPTTVPVTVSYTTRDGSATLADGDYARVSGTLTFDPLSTVPNESLPIVVNVLGDRTIELNELFSFDVQVTSVDSRGVPTAAATRPTTDIVVRNDDRGIVIVDPNLVSADEGDSGTTTNFDFPVRIVDASDPTGTTPIDVDVDLTISYTTSDGSAHAGDNDYGPLTGVLVIDEGASSGMVRVEVRGDDRVEADEDFGLILTGLISGDRAIGFPGDADQFNATGVIHNDDDQQAQGLRFDFDHTYADGSTSPTAAGFTQVVTTDVYSAATGFGWRGIQGLDSRDRRAPDPLNRDFHLVRAGGRTFSAHVDNGTYDVIVHMGELFNARDRMQLKLENQVVDTVSLGRGEYVNRSYRTTVSDGVLDFELRRAGGTGASINGLEIIPVIGNPTDSVVSITSTANGHETATEDAVFTVTQTSPTTTDTVLAFTVAGTAESSRDFRPLSGTVTIPAGSTSATIDVGVIDDAVFEGPESVVVSLTNVVSSSPGVSIDTSRAAATVQILDNDTASLRIDNVRLPEGNSGTTPFTFTATLTGAVQDPFTVDFRTQDDPNGNAATASVDYIATQGTLAFSGFTGERRSFTVDVVGDTDDEQNEAFLAFLENVSNTGIRIDDNQAAGVIRNDDGIQSEFHIDFGTSRSPVADGYIAVIPSDVVTSDERVGWLDNTGIESRDRRGPDSLRQDYHLIRFGTRTFAVEVPDGVYSVSVTVGSAANARDRVGIFLEDTQVGQISTARNEFRTETWTVNVTDGRLELGVARQGGSAASINGVSIVPAGASIRIDNAGPVVEGDSGSVELVFTATLSVAGGGIPGGVAVDYSTADDPSPTYGARAAEGDYDPASGTITFAGVDGETREIRVRVNGDSIVERTESFLVHLNNPTRSDVTLADPQAAGLIGNDDNATITVFRTTDGTENGPVDGVFTIRQSHVSSEPTTISYTTAGTAAAGDDYRPASGTAVIPAGATETTVTIEVVDDASPETEETVELTITSVASPTGSVTISPNGGSATITVTDNDDSSFAWPDGTIFVADRESNGSGGGIHRIDPVTGATTVLATGFVDPSDVYVEPNGNLLVVDAGTRQVTRLDTQTQSRTVISSGGLFDDPNSIVRTGDGRIFVSDSHVGVIEVDPATGSQTLVASGFVNAKGIAADANGGIVLADVDGNSVWHIDPDTGSRTVLAGGGLVVNPFDVDVFSNGDVMIVAQHGQAGIVGADGGVLVVDSSGTVTARAFGGLIKAPLGGAIGDDGSFLVLNDGAFGPQPGVVHVGADGTQTFLSRDGFVRPEGVFVVNPRPFQPPVSSALQFDFGTAVSAVGPDYVRVTPADSYSTQTGFGWLDTTWVDARDRSRPDDIRRDYNIVRRGIGTFAVDVANGAYEVTAIIGSMANVRDRVGISMEGGPWENMSAARGEFAERTFPVVVSDGRIEVHFTRQGGSAAAINSLSITPRPAAATVPIVNRVASPGDSGGSSSDIASTGTPLHQRFRIAPAHIGPRLLPADDGERADGGVTPATALRDDASLASNDTETLDAVFASSFGRLLDIDLRTGVMP